MEYGAEHLHIPLLIVLGHESCGAVTAAVQGGAAKGHIATLVNLIKPSVDKSRGIPGDGVANAVRINVQLVVQQLRSSTPVYSLETGEVTWLSD